MLEDRVSDLDVKNGAKEVLKAALKMAKRRTRASRNYNEYN